MTRPTRPWAGRSHAQLAELVREFLLAGHLIDRSGMPHLISQLGRDGMRDVAIGEWMAASPVYTKRMQRLLGFQGTDVTTIFKGMQLDIGAPPEFMDFRLAVQDAHHGTFHLDHCGALLDVEPMGPDFVQTMCHDIEDPTFDATAIATNPHARVRPVHRPPRLPADRHPHCAWTVTIDETNDPLPIPPTSISLGGSTAARVPLAEADGSLPADDGHNDYAGDLEPDLVMECFSSATLAAIADEVALQGQLLARAFLVEVADRVDPNRAREIGTAQAAGIAGLTAKRLARALDTQHDLVGLAAVLTAHPLLLPRAFVAADVVSVDAGRQIVLSVGSCPALDEPDGLTWPALLTGVSGDEILIALVTSVLPTAAVERLGSRPGSVMVWSITDDPSRPPAPQPDAVTLTEFSLGATFEFARRIPSRLVGTDETVSVNSNSMP